MITLYTEGYTEGNVQRKRNVIITTDIEHKNYLFPSIK